MKTLILNTYAGSLLLGARAAGAEIVGSYEDAGFGQPIAKANFPDVHHIASLRDWPSEVDLNDTFVIAHPPCSAFSVQNNSLKASVRGVDSEAFACTKRVLDYSMNRKRKAIGVAVESVMGALNGGWNIHQQFADANGYHLYRVLQNGAMFGPQWRERFWAVFIRQGVASDTMTWRLTPRWETVGQRLAGVPDSPPPANLASELTKQRDRLRDWVPAQRWNDIWSFDERTTSITNVLHEKVWPQADREAIFTMYVGTFASSQLVFVATNGLASCLLGTTMYMNRGKLLGEKAYQRIMGFPADYVFPPRQRNGMRMFLSKGVIPQVAEWVLTNVYENLGWKTPHQEDWPATKEYMLEVEPNHIADFRFSKRDWPLGPTGLEEPPLRGD